ncbi:MAG: cell wall hydrolase/autolysin [Proteobacteria bacterium]|nr:cell wall hydrolase/autolysin [Pseudomonadota bacterium]
MHMIRVAGWLSVALLLLSGPVIAATSRLDSISLATADRDARLLFDLSAPAKSSFTHDPVRRRLVIRLENATMAATLRRPPAAHPYVANIAADRDERGMRIHVSLKKAVSARLFPAKQGHRWIVQLTEARGAARGNSKENATRSAAAGPAREAKPSTRKSVSRGVAQQAGPSVKDLVIAIDAGHGGKDTGAIGRQGTREKDVVLAIARKLAWMIGAEPGMRPVLIRKSDEFIDLRKRAEIARRARADIFISLHADAYIDADAKGSAVFTLSDHGASSVAARWLADRENSADLVGGVKLRDKGKVLASVLLDLSQSATAEASDRAATRILNELRKNHHLHHREVQKAGFVVLKSPDIPSLLVETAFISNPEEEKNLLSGKYQEQIARSIFWGIRAYFAKPRNGERPEPAVRNAGDGRPEIVAQE